MNNNEWIYRLEFNEKASCFHFEWLADIRHVREANTHGWGTVCDSLPEDDCCSFVRAVAKKYPGLHHPEEKGPTLNQVRAMFDELYNNSI